MLGTVSGATRILPPCSFLCVGFEGFGEEGFFRLFAHDDNVNKNNINRINYIDNMYIYYNNILCL